MSTAVLFAALLAAVPVSAPARAATPVNPPSVKAGIDAWQQHDYAAAVAIWKPLAAKGDVDAQFNLGQAYRLGRGVPISLGAAQYWLERAARQGHLDARTTLGMLLFNSGNRVGGLHWLNLAADAGEPRAQLIYGTALFNGDGIARNPVLAYALVGRAAAQGLAPAKTTLVRMDQILSIEQRQQGVAIALSRAVKPSPSPSLSPTTAAAAKPATKSVSAALAAPPAPTGNWRVQLGAFGNRGAAENLFKHLSSAGALTGRQPNFVAVGAITRLQAGPFASRAAATAACASLKGHPCFPVAGN